MLRRVTLLWRVLAILRCPISVLPMGPEQALILILPSQSRERERERVSIDTQTVDDSRTYKRCECSKIRPPKPLGMRLPGEGAYTTLRHSKERQRRPGFVKLGQFNYVWMNESGRRGKFLSFTTNLPLQFHTLTTPNITDCIPI
jgi:hypothetical protein